ncbi:hypothetical protein JD79_00887 [Geodermatophilus normandii]|uniref:Uncharacterized protein n=1 Tax=Geodermatophilus normandii TaxID=1137989 RepID=A0A317QFA3_9ACTN|nr:hypothetical protein JD79_00887 [Geodermatophilus normandii]
MGGTRGVDAGTVGRHGQRQSAKVLALAWTVVHRDEQADVQRHKDLFAGLRVKPLSVPPGE